jgi:hypothetical protein
MQYLPSSLEAFSFDRSQGRNQTNGVTQITAYPQELGNDIFTPMSPQSPKEFLEYLRASLKHFDECTGIGDPRGFEEMRRRLALRIANVERIMQLAKIRRS